jgi:hypothetical protein
MRPQLLNEYQDDLSDDIVRRSHLKTRIGLLDDCHVRHLIAGVLLSNSCWCHNVCVPEACEHETG